MSSGDRLVLLKSSLSTLLIFFLSFFKALVDAILELVFFL